MHRIETLSKHLRGGRLAEESHHPLNHEEEKDGDLALRRNETLATDDTSLGARLYDLYKTFTAPVEFSAKNHGGKLVADVLKAHGVRFVFTLSGGHISPILVACEDVAIRVIDTREEVNSVFAADAVSRLTGTVGVCAVTAGPGVTNTVTALKNAQMAESPLLLLGGATATLTRGRGALQDVDQMSVMKSVCKYTVSVDSVRDIVPALRRAFREAASDVPGPVFVEFPLDVLYPITEAMGGMGLSERKYKKDLTPADTPRVMLPVEFKDKTSYLESLKGNEAVFLTPNPANKTQSWIVNEAMKLKLKSLYAGGFEPQELGPLPISTPQPDQSHVNRVVEMLRKASRPVLVIGSQATLGGPKAVNALAEAVKRLNIPTFLGGMARGLLGKDCPCNVRQNRGVALKKADLIILAGAVCDFRLGYGRELPKGVPIVSINRSATQGTLNSGIFWSYALFSQSCAGLFLRALSDSFFASSVAKGGNPAVGQWLAQLKEGERKKEEANRKKAGEIARGRVPKWADGPTEAGEGPQLLNPLDLLQRLEEVLPDDAILVVDGGDFVATAAYTLRARAPLSFLDPGAYGTLGVGGGFAIGAKLVHPERPVVIIWGDGSCGYSISELDTCARHGIPIVALVGNDASWQQIEREQLPMFSRDTACALAYCDYDVVAKGYGAKGVKLELGDDLKAVFKRAFDETKGGKDGKKPFLMNALIGATNFREGSISV